MAKRSEITPEYGWNESAGRYVRLANGRFVGSAEVRAAIDGVIRSTAANMRGFAEGLRAGRMTLANWQTAMAREIKRNHLANAASARGGWAQLTPADLTRVSADVRKQLEYLRGFAADIASGKQKLNGRFLLRSDLYANASRATYHEFERLTMAAHGFDEERNVLLANEHCDGCERETARGWVKIGELLPIGSRDCLAMDKCRIEYRNSATGVTR